MSSIRRRILLAELTPKIPLPQIFCTWNPADKHADIALSGGNLVATKSTTHASDWACVRGSVVTQAGQRYWETTVAYTGSADFSVGVSSLSHALSLPPGHHWLISQIYSVGIAKNGDVSACSVVHANIGAIASGSVIRHWLDLDARIYRVAVGGGAWHDLRATVADPSRPAVGQPLIAGSYGGSASPVIPDENFPLCGIVRPVGTTCSITANFGGAPFTYPVPDGANPGVYTAPSEATKIYLGSEGFDAKIGKDNVHFMGRIAGNQDVEIEREGSCWVWGGQSISRRGQLVAITNDGALDDWRNYIWRDASVVLRAGWEGDSFESFNIWAYSRVDSIELTRDARIVLALADPVAGFDRSAQPELYPADQANLQLAGQPLPIVYGSPLYCTAAKLSTNPTERDNQLHDDAGATALTSIAAIYDSGDLFNGPDDGFTPHDAVTAENGGDFLGWVGVPAWPANWVPLPGDGTWQPPNNCFSNAGLAGYVRCISLHSTSISMTHNASTLRARTRYRITFACTSISTAGALIFRVAGSPDVSVSLTTIGAKSVALYARAEGKLQMVMHGLGMNVVIRNLRVSAEQVVDWTYWGGTRGFSLANTPAGKVVANPENLLNALNWIVDDIAARTQVPSIDLGDAVWPGVDAASVSRLAMRNPYFVSTYIDKPMTGLALLRSLLDGWCGYVTSNRLGQIVVGRIEEPSHTAVLQLDETNIIGDIIVTTDRAKNLTIRLSGAKNHTVHTDGEIATGVPTELATALQTEYLHTVEGAPLGDEPVSSAYVSAIAAPAQATLLQRREDLQAEANRVATLWRPQRNFYQLTVLLDASSADALEPGQTVRLVWPRWGLDGGKNLLVVGVRSRFFARRVDLKLWG